MAYDEYFDVQYGGSRQNGIERVYIGMPNQRSHGIDSFLGGLFYVIDKSRFIFFKGCKSCR